VWDLSRGKRINWHEKACELVKRYEEKQGRHVNRVPQGSGYDLESKKNGNVRLIEVKATTGEKPSRKRAYQLTLKEWKTFSEKRNAWIYLVYSIKSIPKLVRIQRTQIKIHQIKVVAPQINLRFPKKEN
jgi:hypothetical protein